MQQDMGFQDGRARYAAQPPPPPLTMSMEQVLSRVHDAIHSGVWEAVEGIMHLETTWSEAELSKRLVKYMYKSASNENLLTLEWDQICEQLVKGMFDNGFHTSCGDCEWFYEIDLAPALSSAAMVLLPGAGWRVTPQQAYEAVSAAYQGNLDRITLEKAIWEMVENLFDDEKVRTKVYNATSRAYEPALQTILADVTPQEDIQRIEGFVRRWIEDSTCRAWGGLHEQAEEVLNQEALVQMFDHLLQPFGDEHPFSCIPRVLSEGIGAPPPGWDFIPQVVEELSTQWENDKDMPSKKRRKKMASKEEEEDADFEASMEAVEEEEPQAPRIKPVAKARAKVAAAPGKKSSSVASKKVKVEEAGQGDEVFERVSWIQLHRHPGNEHEFLRASAYLCSSVPVIILLCALQVCTA